MEFNKEFISSVNSYDGNTPVYIVIHNTDNYAATANARAHAKAQHDGNFSGMSAHIYVDDKEIYQAMPYDKGAWHVGVNYGGKLFGTVNNRNSIGIEICVNKGYDYSKAIEKAVQVCKKVMQDLGIPADRVVSHYDVCAKDCPSDIRARGDWGWFKKMVANAEETQQTKMQYYRIRKAWEDVESQIGAYTVLENAIEATKEGYRVYDWNGKQVYPEPKKPEYEIGKTYTLQSRVKVRKGPGSTYDQMKHEELTEDGKKHDSTASGCLDKGTVVTCIDVQTMGREIWIKAPSGWLCAYEEKVNAI